MPRVNNVIQQVSQLNTYEQEKVFDFLKTVLMSNGITNSIVNVNIFLYKKWKIIMYNN